MYAQINCGGNFAISVPNLAGFFDDSTITANNLLVSVLTQNSPGQTGTLSADSGGNINLNNLNEGNTWVYGTYELPYTNI
jgi:hypothetical protein